MNDPVRRRMLENLQRDQERSDQARHASAKGDDRTGPVETVLLDRAGVIVAVNDAWRAFGEDNEGDPTRSNVGVSYLAACDDASDDADVRQVAVAIRAAIAGHLPAPMIVRVTCPSPARQHWFDVFIASRFDVDGGCLGATVTRCAATPEGASTDHAEFGLGASRDSALKPVSPAADGPGPSSAPSRLGSNGPAFGEPASVGPAPRRPDGASRDAEPVLWFPDIAKMELEEIVSQMTARAQDVLAAQGRLRGLLRANAAVISDLSLPVVLRQIVTAAKDLVQARYAALGIVRNGVLEQFIHVGMQPSEVEQIGELPRGRGILGLLITHPVPVRLTDLSAHPAAVGFPPDHPPMSSLLGVPIRVRDQVFGNLYLTESANGEFTAEDEQLVTALAATAGVAIANAHLYEQTEQHRKWLSASAELTQQLFAGSDESPLDLVLRYAARGAQADSATLVMRMGDNQLRVEAATGLLAERLNGRVLDADRTLAGRVIESGKPVLTDDYPRDFRDSAAVRDVSVPIRTAIGVPLLAAGNRVLGALTFGRVPGRPGFTEIDRDQLFGFAGHAGLALELDRARTEHEALRTLNDHERIAADLHDHVIQELFATGMGLQGMITSLDRPDLQIRVAGYVDALDGTIRQIRATIFQLQKDRRTPTGLQHRVLSVLAEQAAALGFNPGIEFAGPLDHQVSSDLGDDIVAVIREALSNAARHAHARAVYVRLAARGTALILDITDDGCGIGNTTRSSGLGNIRRRAQNNAGTLEISTPPKGGTHLHWTATISGRAT